MVKKCISSLALIIYLTAFASCSLAQNNTPITVESNNDTASVEIFDVATDIKSAANTAETGITDNKLNLKSADGVSIIIEASYPTVTLSDSTVSQRINNVIKDYIDSNYAPYYDLNPGAAVDTIHSKMMYEITLFNGVKLSIHFSSSFAGSGGVQIVTDTSFTFDLQTGDLIPLSELCVQEELTDAINVYFDRLDEAKYPTLFRVHSKEEIRNDFLALFCPESKYYESAMYNSYYITEDKLYLFAGNYKGYTIDTGSILQGDRAFAAEIDRISIPQFAIPKEIQRVALEFFEAYMLADLEAAKALMNDESNECLKYFPSKLRSLNSAEIRNMQMIYEKSIEDGSISYTQVGIDLQIFEKELDSCVYMCLTLENFGSAVVNAADSTVWAVTWYDFDA